MNKFMPTIFATKYCMMTSLLYPHTIFFQRKNLPVIKYFDIIHYMPLLGAHMSIEGGVSNAPLRGKEVGCDVIQIFTKNNNQWNSKPITDKEINAFKENLNKTGIKAVASHDAYLINLASPKKDVYKKSLIAFYDEMQRAEALGLPYLVFHPGAHLGEGEEYGIKRIADSVNLLLSKSKGNNLTLLLETTAGQGTHLGHRFEQLAEIINLVEQKEKMGVCVDTCHIFAAGYDISAEEGYIKTFDEFDRIIGLKRLKLFHLNDSKRDWQAVLTGMSILVKVCSD